MLEPIEKAILTRAYPQMLAAKARRWIEGEADKGCRPDIADYPVPLEPPYHPIGAIEDLGRNGVSGRLVELPADSQEWIRLRVWVSPEQSCEWNRSELFLKQLVGLRCRAAWEIVGNESGIYLQILCHPRDDPLIQAAFRGEFEQCRATPIPGGGLLAPLPRSSWDRVAFHEFYPPPPYSYLMTRPGELKRSPYTTLLAALSTVPEGAVGVYQVLFAPAAAEHRWHRNIQFLHDVEYAHKLLGGLTPARGYAQQAPSGDLRQMAMELESKAHNDKRFFVAVLRVAVLNAGEHADSLLRALSMIAGVILHGGEPLQVLNADHFRVRLSAEAIRRMFVDGLTHRPGFLVNSEELSSLVHIPPPESMAHVSPIMNLLETLPPDDALLDGTPIGYCEFAGERMHVCIPHRRRVRHGHLIGRSGTGKTSVMEGMILDDIRRGAGVAVLDPHGDLTERLLCLIPADAVERTIYVDPGDLQWVPKWNPFHRVTGEDVGRIADDLVDVFKSFVDGWGDRLEHIFRNVFYAVLSLPHGTLFDASNLLRSDSDESKQLRNQILDTIDNESARRFWEHDFHRYRNDEFSPPRNKLSKLLLTGTVSLMVSQPESAIQLGEIMDQGRILLVNLATVGSQVRSILGCLILSVFRQETLRRSKIPPDRRREFHIYIDEAHRFMTDALDDVIAEARKYRVSLTLAHQHLSQFGIKKTDALAGVGSTVIFNVDRDARSLAKILLGKVRSKDLMTLEDYQAIARIGQHVVRIRTYRPPDIAGTGIRDAIIARSRSLYCQPAEVVARMLRERYREQEVTGSHLQTARGDSPSANRDGPSIISDSAAGPPRLEEDPMAHDSF
jgi:hypothetical protein